MLEITRRKLVALVGSLPFCSFTENHKTIAPAKLPQPYAYLVRFRIVDRNSESPCGEGQQLFIVDSYKNDQDAANHVIAHLAQLQSDTFGTYNNLKAIDIDIITLEKSVKGIGEHESS